MELDDRLAVTSDKRTRCCIHTRSLFLPIFIARILRNFAESRLLRAFFMDCTVSTAITCVLAVINPAKLSRTRSPFDLMLVNSVVRVCFCLVNPAEWHGFKFCATSLLVLLLVDQPECERRLLDISVLCSLNSMQLDFAD